MKAIRKYKKFILNLLKISYYFLLLKIFYYFLPRLLREQYSDSIKIYAQKISKVFNYKVFNYKVFYRKIFYRNKKSDVLLTADLGIIIENSNGLLLSQIVERNSKVSSPKLYVDGTWRTRLKLDSKLPDVKVAELKRVNVLGSTDAVIYGDSFFHYELHMMSSQHDLKCPDIFFPKHNKSIYTINTFCRRSFCRRSIKNGKALSLLKEHSTNYYHWITELIPKLLQMLKSLTREEKRVYILVDEGIPEQSLELLELLLEGSEVRRYKIVKIKYGESVYCEQLLYCTPLWTALDNTKHLPNPKKEFFLSIDNLKQVKEEVHRKFEGKRFSAGSKKLYLQRKNNKLRKIHNILEVERLLYKHGFDFIDTASLSFEAQFELFSHAEIVIGNSGAAFTNLLFMKEGSTAIALYPSVQSTNYYVFQPLADVSHVELIHFLTKPATESESVHGDALVDIGGLNTLLEEITV